MLNNEDDLIFKSKMPEKILPTIPQWFSGQHVLITGATGFMGKVLVEKLLRCCPDISCLYLLVRQKRGRSAKERLEDFINTPVFDLIRDSPKSSKVFSKLRCVSGDVMQKNLNICNEDLQVLQENVTTVFHMAANVRFDQPLKTSLTMNTGGTLNVLEVAENLKKLTAFVHVSTSYCHCDETELEERFYPAPHNPKKVLDLVTWMDEDLLTLLTPRLLKNAPNTYAYTKCLTEQLVVDYAKKIPIAIARPSIVVAAWKEPIPGWVDNLNGPTGLLVGAGKGVIRSMHCNPDFQADAVPVDVCMNSIILTAWKLGNSPRNIEPLFVNVTASHEYPITWGEALDIGRRHFYDNPFSICLWYPGGSIKSSYFLHMLAVFFLHIIPAYFIDFLLMITRGKPFLVRTQKRISNGLEVLQYYTTRPWKFCNDKIKDISQTLTEDDKFVFYTDVAGINWNNYLLSYVLGARKYCVHEEHDTLPHARKVLKRLYYLDLTKNLVFGALLGWFLFTYFWTILHRIEGALENVIHYV